MDLGGQRGPQELLDGILSAVDGYASLIAVGNIHGQGEILLKQLEKLPRSAPGPTPSRSAPGPMPPKRVPVDRPRSLPRQGDPRSQPAAGRGCPRPPADDDQGRDGRPR